ncbi:MAG: prolipoprotein diacylglyceryl transferase [Chloroflexi bacterium]|nr:prolipoprotein diacylglyceryl transferase [Chloroflexota bacterium]MBL7189116.1 prolipoprotein diacylglyceryl transferase [Phycisphaerae bacterium]
MPVHPTQLYEAIYGLALFCGIVTYRKYQKRDGELAALLFIFYPLGRFMNEFLRADDRGTVWILSLPQFLCVLAAIVAVSFLLMNRVSQHVSLSIGSNSNQELTNQ